MVNQSIKTLDALEDLLVTRCRSLAADTHLIQSHTLFQLVAHRLWRVARSINGKSYQAQRRLV